MSNYIKITINDQENKSYKNNNTTNKAWYITNMVICIGYYHTRNYVNMWLYVLGKISNLFINIVLILIWSQLWHKTLSNKCNHTSNEKFWFISIIILGCRRILTMIVKYCIKFASNSCWVYTDDDLTWSTDSTRH